MRVDSTHLAICDGRPYWFISIILHEMINSFTFTDIAVAELSIARPYLNLIRLRVLPFCLVIFKALL